MLQLFRAKPGNPASVYIYIIFFMCVITYWLNCPHVTASGVLFNVTVCYHLSLQLHNATSSPVYRSLGWAIYRRATVISMLPLTLFRSLGVIGLTVARQRYSLDSVW